MNYTPGHSYVVKYAVETGNITESTNGMGAATLPSASSLTRHTVGFTNVPQLGLTLGNHVGYGIGSSRGLYQGRGRVEPTVNFTLRLGSLDFLTQCLRNGSDTLPDLAIFVGRVGQASTVFRFSKCGQVQLNFQDSSGGGGGGGGKGGGGGELTAQVQFMSIAMEEGPILTTNATELRALGTPLMWHDVRRLTIAGTDYRAALMSQQWTLSHNLERKNMRPDWGDNVPLSRTCYGILEHQQTVSGTTQFHNELNGHLLTAASRSQDWGAVQIVASDTPTGGDRTFTVTATEVMPQSAQQNETEASAQVQHSIPVVATGLDITGIGESASGGGSDSGSGG